MITGGGDYQKQLIALQSRPHCIVCTPGRLSHLLSMDDTIGDIFRSLRFLIIDEFDRLLEDCFDSDWRALWQMLHESHFDAVR